MSAPRLRVVAFNDVYELKNLAKVQTFLSKLSPSPTAVVLAGDFLSPSTLSSLDGGRGMVATLRAMGLTHACIGNHEADLKLPMLKKRLTKLSKSVVCLNSNIGPVPFDKAPWWTPELTPPYSIIQTPCARVKVALIGLLSDETGIFRDGTFRGAPIQNVCESLRKIHNEVIESGVADFLLPLTHMSIQRDRELAAYMLNEVRTGSGLILGGHEHDPYNVIVKCASNKDSIRILKSGCNAKAVSLVDLTFDLEGDRPVLAACETELVEMSNYEDSVVVGGIVDSHMAVVKNMENETIVHAESLLPPGITLSSKGTRCKQTTVGGVFCKAIKEELEVDVAIINGATIKGDAEYESSDITYAELKQELPFPTKIVVVPMKRWELHEAIHYSRTKPPAPEGEQDDGNTFERRGYLQVDAEFSRIGFHTGDQDDDLMVALPRNLLKGFCEIKPLMAIGGKLALLGTLPSADDFIPGIDLVIRHFCKERWFEIVHEISFDELDFGHKGVLDRSDVKRLLRRTIGHEPADFVVDDMIAAIDTDENGVIDPGEYSHLLAMMEREHGLVKFDN
jgi:2',3'-cyclic-nucleotide 2'-phosphodiesterase (5'-nucleotidase family)